MSTAEGLQGCEEFGLSFLTHCARGRFHAPDNVGQGQKVWMDRPLGRSERPPFPAESDMVGTVVVRNSCFGRSRSVPYLMTITGSRYLL